MSNIQPLSLDTPGEAGEILGAIRQKIGMVPNLYATFAHSPAVLKGLLGFNESLASGALPASLREQIALAVAGANGCDYCASAHSALAKGAGVSAEEASRNLLGKATDARIQAILEFTTAVVQKRGWLDGGELDAVRAAGVTDQEVVEIVGNIAANLLTNYFNHIAGTEIDFPRVETGRVRHAA